MPHDAAAGRLPATGRGADVALGVGGAGDHFAFELGVEHIDGADRHNFELAAVNEGAADLFGQHLAGRVGIRRVEGVLVVDRQVLGRDHAALEHGVADGGITRGNDGAFDAGGLGGLQDIPCAGDVGLDNLVFGATPDVGARRDLDHEVATLDGLTDGVEVLDAAGDVAGELALLGCRHDIQSEEFGLAVEFVRDVLAHQAAGAGDQNFTSGHPIPPRRRGIESPPVGIDSTIKRPVADLRLYGCR